MLRPSNKLSLRPNDKNVLYRPPDTYEYLYQMPHYIVYLNVLISTKNNTLNNAYYVL